MRKGKPVHGRVVRQAQLHLQGDNQVPRAEAEQLPAKELVEPDVVQRPPNGRAWTDAGIRSEGERRGTPPDAVGHGRRRNPS